MVRMDFYYILIIVMAVIAVVVFVSLFFVRAGYGYLNTSKWGPTVNNKLGWILMETPAFLFLLIRTLMFHFSGVETGNSRVVLYVMAGLFLVHYFQRSFIFPLIMRGKSRMSVAVMVLGMVFNTVNAYIISAWLYKYAPAGWYGEGLRWLLTPQFIIGTVVFIAGMAINLDSDRVIRHLRKPGDTKHYIPRRHLYKYVTSANYFGELTEWIGYAVLTWSPAGLLFAFWTFANLAPRSKTLTDKYIEEFGDEYKELHKKNLIPFIW